MAAIDIGDPLPNLAVLVENPPGTPVNVGTMTLTITLPDGTTTTPVVVAPTTTGNYASTYVAAQGGLHRPRWVGTGANACVLEQYRSVGDPVDIAELRTSLKILGTASDDLLWQWVAAATDWAQDRSGRALRTGTVVDRRRGGKYAVPLSRTPVKAITSVSVNGTLAAATDYEVDPGTGLLYRGTMRSGSVWPDGWVEVTYTTATDLVPARFRQGITEYVRYLAAQYRGSSSQPAAGGNPLDALDAAEKLIRRGVGIG